MSSRRSKLHGLLAGVWLLSALIPLAAQTEKSSTLPDLAEFKTVETARTTKITKGASLQTASPGYLGVQVSSDAKEKLIVNDVDEQSPAAKAGVRAGDVVVEIDGRPLHKIEVFRGILQTKTAGEQIKLTLRRQDEIKEVSATLTATSKVMQVGKQRVVMGVQFDDLKDGDGATIKVVTSGMPAEKAGLKAGDVILKIDNRIVGSSARVADILIDKMPGDLLTLLVKKSGDEKETKVELRLVSEEKKFAGKGGKGGGGWDNRELASWKKGVYKLAIVGIEYPDVKHNDKITDEAWEESLFSTKSYVKSSVTGQKVHGSLNDYYQEQSFGKLRVEGKFFSFVQVSKKRSEYAQANTGPAKTALLGEALDKLFARDGKKALDGFDGIFFLYAGDRVQTNRGGLYWPHRASFTHQDKRWSYFIVQEGGQRMCDISVICHEFGHMLGLPDLYARPENPGSEGVGQWCAMSNQVGGGKPQHFSAWSKEQLGWIQPAIIDPTEKQKLILAPIEDSPKECFKVLVRPDGSEYFLLENRRKKGFDQSVPAEGLLIWRVVGNRPILEESHGVEGPTGPRVFLDSVPFPSAANRSFTPYTTPSSRSQLGGGLPVHITNIRRLPDGRITFHVGYEYY